MQGINSATDLRDAILQLENRQAEEGKMLREQFHFTYNSIRPINLLRSTFEQATASPEIKDTILNSTVGLTAGYLSKLFFEGASKSPLKKLLGTILMFSIKNIVAKNPRIVKTLGEKFITIVKHKPELGVNGAAKSEEVTRFPE